MKRLPIILMLLLATTSAAWAQDWAKAKLEQSPRHLEWVTLTHGNRELACYVGYPEIREKTTVIVVIHDVWGMSEWARGVVDDFAAAGYIAVAPDLLWDASRQGGTSKLATDDIPLAMRALPADQITADLRAAVQYAANLPAGNGKVVVIGFCWGGSECFRFATNSTAIEAALVFYGDGPSDPEVLARIPGPVLGFYAEYDARINETVLQSQKGMKAAGKRFDPAFYAGAGHGFMKAGEAPPPPASAEPAVHERYQANRHARASAWQRVLAFLKTL